MGRCVFLDTAPQQESLDIAPEWKEIHDAFKDHSEEMSVMMEIGDIIDNTDDNIVIIGSETEGKQSINMVISTLLQFRVSQ